MNKKVDEEFKGINDVYALQCICTELKELCDKYEEEHNTTFKEWQQDMLMNKATIKDVEKYKSRCEEAIEYINKHFEDDEGIICKIIDEHTCDANYNFLEDLINILEGKDEYNK